MTTNDFINKKLEAINRDLKGLETKKDLLQKYGVLLIEIGHNGIVPYYLNAEVELCYSGKGWCNFEFYLR